MLTVHFSHCLYKIFGALKRHETVALRFARALVAHYLGLLKRGVLLKGACQRLVVHFVAQITTKQAKIV